MRNICEWRSVKGDRTQVVRWERNRTIVTEKATVRATARNCRLVHYLSYLFERHLPADMMYTVYWWNVSEGGWKGQWGWGTRQRWLRSLAITFLVKKWAFSNISLTPKKGIFLDLHLQYFYLNTSVEMLPIPVPNIPKVNLHRSLFKNRENLSSLFTCSLVITSSLHVGVCHVLFEYWRMFFSQNAEHQCHRPVLKSK